jgi:imidazolonepropionase-like amidohydrolase
VTTTLYVEAGRVVTGDGDAFRDGAVLIADDRIEAVGPVEDVSPEDADREYHLPEHTLLPGLIDAHVHIASLGDPNRSAYVLGTSTAERVIQTVGNARATVEAGITTVRDVGSPGDVPMVVRDAVADGTIRGPRIVTCGQGLTATGGHGDAVPPHLSHEGVAENGRVANGVAAVRTAVREQLQRGADAVKVWATGGVIDPEGEIDVVEYSQTELNALVEEADRHNAHVAAHAHPPSGIQSCVEAGVRSIEHGMYVDEESAALMAEHGTYLVSTLSVMERLSTNPDVPEYYRTNSRAAMEHHASMLPTVREMGVPLAMGTDAGAPTYDHGGNASELVCLADAGLDAADVIEIATRNTAELLEFDDLGVLEPGYLADVIAVAGDPLDDVSVLADPENVSLVVGDGRVQVEPSTDPGA